MASPLTPLIVTIGMVPGRWRWLMRVTLVARTAPTLPGMILTAMVQSTTPSPIFHAIKPGHAPGCVAPKAICQRDGDESADRAADSQISAGIRERSAHGRRSRARSRR